MSTGEVIVVTDGLTKRFDEFVAVDQFNLEVKAGTVVSLLGPNGAGKTTIVRMLATLIEPSAGTAKVCGYDVVKDGDAVRSVLSLDRTVRRLGRQPHRERELDPHGSAARLLAQGGGSDHREPHRSLRDRRVPRQVGQGGLGRPATSGRLGGQPRRPAPGAGARRTHDRDSTLGAAKSCGARSVNWWPTGVTLFLHHPVLRRGRCAGRLHRAARRRARDRRGDRERPEVPDWRPASGCRRGGRGRNSRSWSSG
jgi:energy-coupling factor transporter ATP-binding protein EcfA2